MCIVKTLSHIPRWMSGLRLDVRSRLDSVVDSNLQPDLWWHQVPDVWSKKLNVHSQNTITHSQMA